MWHLMISCLMSHGGRSAFNTKALLDSTQINDLNAAVDEIKKENDNRGPSKSGK
jgi:hypothetical protein